MPSTSIRWLRPIFSNAFDSFARHRLPRLAATLAYYTLFSVAPLLVIAIVIARAALPARIDVDSELFAQLVATVGASMAETIQSLVTAQEGVDGGGDVTASVVSGVVLFIGASGTFQALQDALNTVWDIPIDEVRGILRSLIRRLYGVVSVLVIGVLMSLFVVGATVVAFITSEWNGLGTVVQALNALIAFLGVSVVTALVFQWLPARRVPWRAAWAGGVLTTLMLVMGSLAIGLLIANANPGATFGQFAAIIVLLVYIYYTAQIFLLGAELTAAYVQVRLDPLGTDQR